MCNRKLTIYLSGVGNDRATKVGKIKPTLTWFIGGYIIREAVQPESVFCMVFEFSTLHMKDHTCHIDHTPDRY